MSRAGRHGRSPSGSTAQPRPLRVALVSSSFDPYPGGVEEHTCRVAAELARRGVEVEVWTVDRGEHLGVRHLCGVTVRYLPTPLPSRRARDVGRFVLAAPVAAARWLRAFVAHRPDVLHVQCFGPNGVYAYALHRLTRRPLVISSHGETFADDHALFDRSRLVPWAMRSALPRSCAVTGCSAVVLADVERRFGAVGGGRRTVVPNGVDPAEGPGASWPAGTAEDGGPVVLAVGRLQRVKGFDLLVRAFARAARDRALPGRARLRIGGDGPDRAGLEALAEDLGIRDRVDLLGRLARPEVLREMARAAVVVVPSRREAFGITVLEAWRAGTAVVATTRGGPPEFVSDGETGLLVDPLEETRLAAALTRVLTDARLRARLGRQGHDRVLRDFTWSRVVDAYEGIYRSCRTRPG